MKKELPNSIQIDGITVVNLTPHQLTLYDIHSQAVEIPAAPHPARVCITTAPVDMVGTLELVEERHSGVEGLPPPAPGTLYVVPRMVAMHPETRGRHDVVVPGRPIRDGRGRIVAAVGLARIVR